MLEWECNVHAGNRVRDVHIHIEDYIIMPWQNIMGTGFEYQDAYIHYSWCVHGPTYERGV